MRHFIVSIVVAFCTSACVSTGTGLSPATNCHATINIGDILGKSKYRTIKDSDFRLNCDVR